MHIMQMCRALGADKRFQSMSTTGEMMIFIYRVQYIHNIKNSLFVIISFIISSLSPYRYVYTCVYLKRKFIDPEIATHLCANASYWYAHLFRVYNYYTRVCV